MWGANYGLFVRPAGDALGVGQSVFGWAHTARIVAVGVASPFIGRLLDRYGARWPLAAAGLLTGLIVLGLGAATQPWHLIVLLTMLGALGPQGGGSLYATVPLARWFVRKRGLAMSLAFIVAPIFAVVAVPGTQLLIDAIGWRRTCLALGVAGGTLVPAIAVLVVRRRPEDHGLLPDGDALPAAVPPGGRARAMGTASHDEPSWTRARAMRSATFWLLAGGFGAMMFGIGGYAIFRIPYFAERGIDPRLAALGISADAGTVAVLGLALGFVAHRVPLRLLGSAGLLLLALSVGVAWGTTTVWQMFAANVIFGSGIACQAVVQNLIWPAYFGREHGGAIRGIAFALSLAVAALGAPAAGMLRDATGDYRWAWAIGIAALVAGAAALALARKPVLLLAPPPVPSSTGR